MVKKRTRKGYTIYARKMYCPICQKSNNLCIVNWLGYVWSRCSVCLLKLGYYTLVKYSDGTDNYKPIEKNHYKILYDDT